MKLRNIIRFLQRIKPSKFVESLVLKPSKINVGVREIVPQDKSDSGRAIVRVHGSLIKTHKNPKGLFKRDSFVKIYNKANGQIFIGQVKGGGSNYKDLKRGSIAIDYDARSALSVEKPNEPVDLLVGTTNDRDENYFYCNFESDRGTRKSHQTEMTHQRVNIAIAIWLPIVQGVLLNHFLG